MKSFPVLFYNLEMFWTKKR